MFITTALRIEHLNKYDPKSTILDIFWFYADEKGMISLVEKRERCSRALY
jgi:hypothetical protein